MDDDTPVVKDLILLGGGHSHVCVLKKFGMRPEPGVRVTLVSDSALTPYSGMLPGFVAGHYTEAECHIDLLPLAKFARARFIEARGCGIDREQRLLHLEGRPSLRYDVLSIDIGIAPTPVDVLVREGNSSANSKVSFSSDSGDSLNLTPVKPISKFSSKWNDLIPRVIGWANDSSKKRPMQIAVVGGGAGGIELLLAMQHRLHTKLRSMIKIVDPDLVFQLSVVTRGDTVLSSHPPRVQRIFRRVLEERNVSVHYGCNVEAVEDASSPTPPSSSMPGGQGRGVLVCASGERIDFDECVWCTSAAAQPWLAETGLKLDRGGFIAIDDTLQSTNSPNIFAAGDVAGMVNHPRPKAGVFAVRQGPPLAINLRNALLGIALEPYVPQENFLGLVSTGDKYAVLSRSGIVGSLAACCQIMEGSFLWKWKDHIDRTWMRGYQELPDMSSGSEEAAENKAQGVAVARAAGKDALSTLSHVAMRCGGCGSKVGAAVLSRVMRRLKEGDHIPTRPEVLVGLDSPDDAAVVKGCGKDMATVHTVDFFRSFISDPYIFGKIAANHALSDCHAMCADARTALAIATVPFAVEEKVEGMLYQMMAGACSVLRESNCALVGGHTAEAHELSLGFAVNGVARSSDVLRKAGMSVGQSIIITKPVGTGTLFAAEMKGKAKGPWVSSAVKSMCISNRKAAMCLRDYGATSCTDVTGFGVLGHLVEMVNACNTEIENTSKNEEKITARIQLNNLPCMDGAVECIENGIFSSLQPANIRLRRAVTTKSQKECRDDPRYPLLFDPQTAGGLLATVPLANVDECIAELRSLGYLEACVLGEVVSQDNQPNMDRGIEVVLNESAIGEGDGDKESITRKSQGVRYRGSRS